MKSWLNWFGALLLLTGSLAMADRAALEKQAAAGDAKAQYQLAEALFWGKGGPQDLEQAVDWARLSAKQGNAKGQFRLAIQLLLAQGAKASVENDQLGLKTLVQSVPGLKKLSAQGDADAQHKLALLYLRGLVKGKDNRPYILGLKEAAVLLEKSANQGNAEAQYWMTFVYKNGLLGKLSEGKALEWLRKAAENGSAVAGYEFWEIYRRSENLRSKLDEAKPLLIAAAKAGLGTAQHQYAIALYEGMFGQVDKIAGIEWLKKSAEQGEESAQFLLGLSFISGEILEQDFKAAYYWLSLARKSSSGKVQNDAKKPLERIQRQLTLDEKFEIAQRVNKFEPKKTLVTRNFRLGLARASEEKIFHMRMELITILARQGNVNAMMRLGVTYSAKANVDEAVRWFEMAAEKNSKEACAELVTIYHSKEERDFSKSIKWLRKGAELGHIRCMFGLGNFIFQGEVKGAKPKEGVKWVVQAAEKGDAEAQTWLGLKRYKGDSMEQDFPKAKEWFMKAARQNYPDAQYCLGRFYREDRGKERNDVKEALKWFRLAARQGHPDAQHQVALFYLRGDGVEKDVREGYRWLIISRRFGMPGVDATLKKYENALTQEEKQRAIISAAQFRPQIFFDPNGGGKEPVTDVVAKLPLKELMAKANQGNADAQFHLAQRYALGDGVKLDSVQAWKWYKLAVISGHDTAEVARQKMVKAQGMTLVQVFAAQKLVRKFKPRKN